MSNNEEDKLTDHKALKELMLLFYVSNGDIYFGIKKDDGPIDEINPGLANYLSNYLDYCEKEHFINNYTKEN